MNVLVVAAHPDDEVLGCGGMARLTREGHSVFMTILGEGITVRLPQPAKADSASFDKMRDCSRSVAGLLGVKDISLHDLRDNRFDSLHLLLNMLRWRSYKTSVTSWTRGL